MSLLLDALKKAEKAKEEAQKRAREGEAEGSGELRLADETPAGGDDKRVVTRDELPSINAPLEIQSDELGAPRAGAEPDGLSPQGSPPAGAAPRASAQPPASPRATARKAFERCGRPRDRDLSPDATGWPAGRRYRQNWRACRR